MTITNGYCTSAQLSEALGTPPLPGDSDNYDRAINTASRWIDQHCARRFTTDAAATARKFYVLDDTCATVDDFHTTTGLEIKTAPTSSGYGTTIASTNYELLPLDGVGPNGATGWPYTGIVLYDTSFLSTSARPALQVTAKWGWAAVPDDVLQACIAAAEYFFKAKDAPFGAAGVADLGITRARMPSVVTDLLVPYRRYGAPGTPMVA